MKINEILSNPAEKMDLSVKDRNMKSRKINNSFTKELDKMKGLNTKEKLNLLLDKIELQSEKITKNTDIKEVIVYKKLISEYLKESVDNMIKYERDEFLDRRGRHRVYAIIKKVNSELEKLTRDVLKKEKDNLGIVKRLDDIRGLILDIYM